MSNPSASHQLVCGIAQRYPQAVVALAETAGVPLPEYDDVQSAPDARQMRDGGVVYTDATARLLRKGRPVFFVTVEMQQKFRSEKYLTLHAYHGSGVRDTGAGGHLFVLSIEAPETEKFRREDAGRRAELAFSASFHSGADLVPLREKPMNGKEGLGARALGAALSDFAADVPGTQELLAELNASDPTLADLYIRAIVERIPKTMLGEVLQPDMLDKLRSLEWFREYEAEVKADAEAWAKADAKAMVDAAKAMVDAAEARVEAARAEATVAKAALAAADAQTVKAAAAVVADALAEFFAARGEKPSEYAMTKIGDCRDPRTLKVWLMRAYQGETSAELFPEPESPAR